MDGKFADPERGMCCQAVLLAGHRNHSASSGPFGPWPASQDGYRQWFNLHSWLYTKAEFDEFDLHVEYWIPEGSNSGVSIRSSKTIGWFPNRRSENIVSDER